MRFSPRSLVLTVVVLTVSLLSAAPAGAADPVDDAVALVNDLATCSIWADEPGGNPVVGSGGAKACGPNQTVAITVCLDYNGITIASSCTPRTGTGSASASTKPTLCLPGLWQTQVVATTPGPDMKVLSDPVLLLCPPIETGQEP